MSDTLQKIGPQEHSQILFHFGHENRNETHPFKYFVQNSRRNRPVPAEWQAMFCRGKKVSLYFILFFIF